MSGVLEPSFRADVYDESWTVVDAEGRRVCVCPSRRFAQIVADALEDYAGDMTFENGDENQ